MTFGPLRGGPFQRLGSGLRPPAPFTVYGFIVFWVRRELLALADCDRRLRIPAASCGPHGLGRAVVRCGHPEARSTFLCLYRCVEPTQFLCACPTFFLSNFGFRSWSFGSCCPP